MERPANQARPRTQHLPVAVKRIAPVVLVICMTLFHGSTSAVAGICNPGDTTCDGDLPINRNGHHVSEFPHTIIVGSPRGPLQGHGYTFQFNDSVSRFTGDTLHTHEGVHVWLESVDRTSSPFLINPTDPQGVSHCEGEACAPAVYWAYQEEVTDANGRVVFTPAFSGSGQFTCEFEFDCPVGDGGVGYIDTFQYIDARSTDMTGSPVGNPVDGDTDQDDKLNLGLLIKNHQASLNYDYNLDGVVDGADYVIVAQEYLAESHPYYPICDVVGAQLSPGPFAPDSTRPAPITDLSDEGGELSWTAPGDDSLLGIAKQYDIRCSMQPITATNFNSATHLDGPAPSYAGQIDRVDRCSINAHYWALKTQDWKGNWSAISNVLHTLTFCLPSLREPGESTPEPTPAAFGISSVVLSGARDDAAVTLAVPAGNAALVEVDVLDVAGRLVRTLYKGQLAQGTATLHWDLRTQNGDHVAGGLFMVRARQGASVASRKLVIAP